MNFLLYTKSLTVGHSRMIKQRWCTKLLYNAKQTRGVVTPVYAGTQRFGPRPYLTITNTLENDVINTIYIPSRAFYVTPMWKSQEPSSKVEKTVKNMKEQKEEKVKESSTVTKTVATSSTKTVVEKRSIWQRVRAEMLHYYHGFRLLGLDIKISAKLIWRILRGKELSRREHRLLVKTTGDVFRLIPFSVFIIVPFMEFLLPVAIKLFPGMLPSTFQTATEKEDKLKQALKVKIEMAKFLQKTLDDMALQSSDHASQRAKEFAEFFYKVRTTGAVASNEDIMRFSKLFEDEITLDSLTRPQLIALCRVLDVQTLGTTNFLRFLLRMRLRSLSADDKLIEKEGVESLTRSELQQACRARGMRAYGMPESKLREQLSQWLDLSLNKKVAPTLLLLSRALMVPDTIPMSDKLKATISALPDTVVARTKGAIGEKEGKVDHRTNIEIIKMEERRIEEEREEREKQIEPQPVVASSNVKKDEITTTDVKAIEQALDSIGKDKNKMCVEKEELKELKEEMAEYQEDIQELYQMKAEAKGEKDIDNIKISKGAKRLFNKVNKMISKMDAVLLELEHSERKVKQQMEEIGTPKEVEAKAAEELVKIDELVAAIKQIQNVPDDHRLKRIAEILGKIDDDRDGSIKIEDVLKVVELIGKEDVKLSKKQVDELIELMDKEEILEVEEQTQKALAEDNKKMERQSSTGAKLPKKEQCPENEDSITSTTAINECGDQPPAVLKPEKSDSVRNPPLTPGVPSPTKKAEGYKHL